MGALFRELLIDSVRLAEAQAVVRTSESQAKVMRQKAQELQQKAQQVV